MFRIGLGIDIHKFEEGRPLVLGGVPIESAKGLAGHSDADVVLHAVSDAFLGAASLGDLGQKFPENEENKNRPSTEILREVCGMIWDRGFKVVNVDIMVLAEEPRLADYRERIIEKISDIINVDKSCVGVKATTCEGLGTIGRAEGICCQAVALLERVHHESR